MRLTQEEKQLIQKHRRAKRRKTGTKKKTAVKRKPNPALNQAIASLLWLAIVILFLLMVVTR